MLKLGYLWIISPQDHKFGLEKERSHWIFPPSLSSSSIRPYFNSPVAEVFHICLENCIWGLKEKLFEMLPVETFGLTVELYYYHLVAEYVCVLQLCTIVV